MVICLGWPSPATSSSLPAALPGSPLARASRHRCGPHLAAYLALLRLGVAVPPLLPAARWALTPPFHPCPGSPCGFPRRSVLCGPFRRLSAPRRYLAVCPLELGLSSGTREGRPRPSRPAVPQYTPKAHRAGRTGSGRGGACPLNPRRGEEDVSADARGPSRPGHSGVPIRSESRGRPQRAAEKAQVLARGLAPGPLEERVPRSLRVHPRSSAAGVLSGCPADAGVEEGVGYRGRAPRPAPRSRDVPMIRSL